MEDWKGSSSMSSEIPRSSLIPRENMSRGEETGELSLILEGSLAEPASFLSRMGDQSLAGLLGDTEFGGWFEIWRPDERGTTLELWAEEEDDPGMLRAPGEEA